VLPGHLRNHKTRTDWTDLRLVYKVERVGLSDVEYTSYPMPVKKPSIAEAYGMSTYRLTATIVPMLVSGARTRELYTTFPNIVRPVLAWRIRNARTIAGSGRNRCRRRSGLYAARV